MENSEKKFNLPQAFSRNIGWLTEDEQKNIHASHVGIIGLGGVGGAYAEILARLGVGEFTLCDPDTFSIENTNRQNECRVSNYGKNKAETLAKLIYDINPQAKVNIIAGAMSLAQVPAFCQNIEIYFDSLDFFEIDVRVEIFKQMRALGKFAITSAPIGTGSSTMVFSKDSMSFDDYFGFHTTKDHTLRSLLFVTGIAPSLQHVKYLQDRTRANFKEHKVPSLPMGVASCASASATTFIKVILNRGEVPTAPWSVHYDPYLMSLKKRYVFAGYRNPLQRLKVFIAKKMVK